jgi:hypothetical protein
MINGDKTRLAWLSSLTMLIEHKAGFDFIGADCTRLDARSQIQGNTRRTALRPGLNGGWDQVIWACAGPNKKAPF